MIAHMDRDRAKLILIADDQPEEIAPLERALLDAGYQVILVSSGDKVIETVKGLRPALVICDLMMPGMDGFEILERMKGDKDLSRIPIIINSMRRDQDYVERIRNLGAMDYFAKAEVAIEDLVQEIKAVLAEPDAKVGF